MPDDALPALTYTVSEACPEASSREIVEGLRAYNALFCDARAERKLAVTVCGEDGRVLAGALGHTQYGWLYLGWLWVSEELRGRGVGMELLRRAEAEGVARGCHHAHLTTLDFQARGFYERQGYSVFAVLEDYPRPHRRFFMRKELGTPAPPAPQP